MEARIEGEYRAARDEVLENIYGWFSDIFLCAHRAGDELLVFPAQAAITRRAAEALSYSEALGNLQAIEETRESLARNISETLALEVGLLKLA